MPQSSGLIRDNPFTEKLKEAILAITETGRGKVEKSEAPPKELNIITLA